jgi:23S rRNA pseudouridine2604 synthase
VRLALTIAKKLEAGFDMDGSRTKPLQVRKIRHNVIRIVLTEGKNRQIRRMCQYVGYTVKELRRVRIATFEDSRIPVGAIRALTKEEKTRLLSSVGI